ncbi:MAG: PilW family protein [Magnetococcales bacterium]|nr:PilW family protein [Magnetococcales bacterium]
MTRLTAQRGMTLIELMIAMTLGFILLAGTVTILESNKATFRSNQAIARMQENARFILDILSREIRQTGYMGCASSPALIHNVLNTAAAAYVSEGWAFNYNNALYGYDNGTPAAFPAAFAASVLAGNDALVLLGMDAQNIFHVAAHSPGTNQFTLTTSHNLLANEVAVVSDCQSGAIFQITGVATPSLSYGGAGSIGNLSTCLSPTCPLVKTFGTDALLARLRATAFYIATGATGEPALWWRRLTGGTVVAEELLSGVENMQILYGYDADNDLVPNQYLTAADVTTKGVWGNIVSLRIGFLMRSEDGIRAQVDTNTYAVVGTNVGLVGTPSHPQDRRLRQVFSTTIQLRNRGT